MHFWQRGRGAPQHYAAFPQRRSQSRKVLRRFAEPERASVAGMAASQPSVDTRQPASDWWSLLPVKLLSALSLRGINCFKDVHAKAESDWKVLRLSPNMTPFGVLLDQLRQTTELDEFTLHRLLLACPGTSGGLHLCDVLAAGAIKKRPDQWVSKPSANISALERLRAAGVDPRPWCEAVATARVRSAVAPSTAETYDSHLRQIRRACLALDVCPLPATLETIRCVSSIVSHPSTLRGWLAAWRRLHCTARQAWAGDRDPFLLAIRMGLR